MNTVPKDAVPMNPPPRGIILTHGTLGDELIRTAAAVVPNVEGLIALSNTGLSTPALAERVESVLAGEPRDRPLFVFVDLLGGSCSQACTELLRARPGARLLTGVNLPMILAFLQCRASLAPDELAEAIVMRAIRGIKAIPTPSSADSPAAAADAARAAADPARAAADPARR